MTPEFGRRADAFRKRLDQVKAGIPAVGSGWYRYNTLNQYPLLQGLIESSAIPVDRLIGPGRVADIGCADGDLEFFLESLGCRVDTIDFPVTNDNGLRGAWELKQALNSSCEAGCRRADVLPAREPAGGLRSGPPLLRLGVTIPEPSIAKGTITLRCSANGVAPLRRRFIPPAAKRTRRLSTVERNQPVSLAFELDKALEPGLDVRELGIIVSSVSID